MPFGNARYCFGLCVYTASSLTLSASTYCLAPTDFILHALHASIYMLCTHIQIEELAKIIYTPVVGRACQSFAHIFRRTRGMYFSSNDRDNMASMVYNWPVRASVSSLALLAYLSRANSSFLRVQNSAASTLRAHVFDFSFNICFQSFKTESNAHIIYQPHNPTNKTLSCTVTSSHHQPISSIPAAHI